MAQNFVKIQSKLLREYYKDFSKYAKGRAPEHKVAYVTSFTPVEILEALEIDYYYPESYAAVIAASGMEQDFLAKSGEGLLAGDCCSYSLCFNGALDAQGGPRGMPPRPDVLIATNNQCNTLPNWWNTLAERYQVPLLVLDYPGEGADCFSYVRGQHEAFIGSLERISGNTFEEARAEALIRNSRASVEAWKRAAGWLPVKKIKATTLFDNINFLITARCKTETAEMYDLMSQAMEKEPDLTGAGIPDGIPLFWLGYPLWYHRDRFLSEALDGFRIVGSNYLAWWNLDYSGKDVWEQLYNAYNFTFLNLTQGSRERRLNQLIRESGARAAVSLHNKSCKCDFVSARNIRLPQAELEIDMIDRTFLDVEKAKKTMGLLKETVGNVSGWN